MDKLESWLQRRGFDLELEDGGDDSVCFDTMNVLINSRLSPSSKLATLLHECGHIAVFQQRLKDRRARVAGSTFHQFVRTSSIRDSRLTRRSRIDTVTEEIEAWDRGEAIAKRLKIRYNKKLFANIRTKSLMTYFRWTVKGSKVVVRQKRGR